MIQCFSMTFQKCIPRGISTTSKPNPKQWDCQIVIILMVMHTALCTKPKLFCTVLAKDTFNDVPEHAHNPSGQGTKVLQAPLLIHESNTHRGTRHDDAVRRWVPPITRITTQHPKLTTRGRIHTFSMSLPGCPRWPGGEEKLFREVVDGMHAGRRAGGRAAG